MSQKAAHAQKHGLSQERTDLQNTAQNPTAGHGRKQQIHLPEADVDDPPTGLWYVHLRNSPPHTLSRAMWSNYGGAGRCPKEASYFLGRSFKSTQWRQDDGIWLLVVHGGPRNLSIVETWGWFVLCTRLFCCDIRNGDTQYLYDQHYFNRVKL